MAVCYIVGAAPFSEEILTQRDDFIIAADGGQAALKARAILPDLVVGDFDSSLPPDSVPYVKHPVEKDDTDTALAIREGLMRGYSAFVLYGCTGGRPDHTYAVVQSMLSAAKKGAWLFLVGEGMVGTVLVNRGAVFFPKGHVSVFSLTDEATGVTLEGLQYPLKDASLTNDFPLGVSNAGNGDKATVCVKKGALYLLWQSDEPFSPYEFLKYNSQKKVNEYLQNTDFRKKCLICEQKEPIKSSFC